MKRNVILLFIVLVIIFIVIFSIYQNFDTNVDDSYISFTNDYLELIEDSELRLTLTKINIKGNLKFDSDNENIVSVNELGIVKALNAGKTFITVEYNDENNKLTDTIEINVVKKYNAKLLSISHEIVTGHVDWNKKDVVAKIIVNDENNIGIKSLKYAVNCLDNNCIYENLNSNNLINITNEGKNIIFVEAIDNEGTTVNDIFEIFIDKSDPVIDFDLLEATYDDYKNVTIKVSDLVSGIKSYDVNVYKNGIIDSLLSKSNINQESLMLSLNEDAIWNIEINAMDNGGNVKNISRKYTINFMGYREGPGGDRYKKTITYKGRTYKVFDQFAYTDVSFWGGNLGSRGCGPVSLAIALSGYDSNITPVTTAKIMSYGTFERIQYALKQLGYHDDGIIYYNSNDQDENRAKSTIEQVRSHLSKGYPLIALVTHYSEKNAKYKNCGGPYKYAETNHFMAILGERENGELIIGNSGGGAQTGTLDEIVRCYLGGGRLGFLKIVP